jgi:hypothetical protein
MTELTPFNRLAEDVRIIPVVVAELKLRDVERQVLGADLVKRADHVALEDRPEALDRVRVDRADDVLALAGINDAVREVLVQPAIAAPLIGAEQANLLRHRAAHEAPEYVAAYAVDNACHDLSLALDGTDYRDFARAYAAGSAALTALVNVPVLGEAPDERLVNLDDPHQLAKLFVCHSSSNAVAHIPSRSVRPKPHHAMDLKGVDTLLTRQHEVNDVEPLAQWLIGVLEDRIDQNREPIAVISRPACVTDPVEVLGMRFNFRVAAARADDEFGPTVLGEVQLAGVVGRKGGFPLGDRHLGDGFGRLFRAGHHGSPVRSGVTSPRLAGKVKHNRPKWQAGQSCQPQRA